MQNHDVKRLAVGIEQKSKNINCGLIYENYLWQIWHEVCHMCRKYHLTVAQYEALLRTTAERMMLPELIEELDDPGGLAAAAAVALDPDDFGSPETLVSGVKYAHLMGPVTSEGRGRD